MTDELISYATAEIAKEKGFNWPCNHYYIAASQRQRFIDEGYEDVRSPIKVDKSREFNNVYQPHTVGCCTQSLLQKWLREVHELDVLVCLTDKSNYDYWLYHSNFELAEKPEEFQTYEISLEKGLYEALTEIKLETK